MDSKYSLGAAKKRMSFLRAIEAGRVATAPYLTLSLLHYLGLVSIAF
jgi:hypothetical protein